MVWEIATTASSEVLVNPQDPVPTWYQVRSPVYSVPDAASPLLEPEDEELVVAAGALLVVLVVGAT